MITVRRQPLFSLGGDFRYLFNTRLGEHHGLAVRRGKQMSVRAENRTLISRLDDWLTVQHRSITSVDLQLDAQILIYLYVIHLLKSSTCFEHYPAHLQEVYVVIVYMQPLVSSLSVGDCPVHRS